MHLKTLREIDGARSIVQTHIDNSMRTLSAREREIASGIFRYLVILSGTKFAQKVSDLANYTRIYPG
jgi:hypothetical protein